MKFIFSRNLLRLAALACAIPLTAQTVNTPATPAAEVAFAAMNDALKLRGDLADSVSKGTLNEQAAISRLKGQGQATGFGVDPETDFAVAAMDVGRRLVVKKPGSATQFFAAAEQSLEAIVQRTSDASAKDKAQLLCQLALIRSEYLGKATQARKDIDQAIALQPKDSYLQQARRVMANSHAEQFPSRKTGT